MYKNEIETFNVPLLYNVVHDNETKKIANQVEEGKWSKFVRQAVLEFAKDKGFEPPTDKPFYIPENKWAKVQAAQKKQRHVNYDYVIAYHWLSSLPLYLFAMKSEIIREAIKFYQAQSQVE